MRQMIERISRAAPRGLAVDVALEPYGIGRQADEGLCGRRNRLAFRRHSRAHGETRGASRQSNGSLFQELSAVRSIGIHYCLRWSRSFALSRGFKPNVLKLQSLN